MDNNAVNIANLIQQRQAQFIETRRTIEMEVNRFLESLGTQDPDVQQKCGYQAGITAKDLLPALWAEPFVQATYNEQLEKLKTYIAGVMSVCDSFNKDALAELTST